MSLTTPVLGDEDNSIPGENWFFYWKTSTKLWREKLKSPLLGQNVFLPVYWGIHSETGQDYDFGEQRPETDLALLVSLCLSEGKNPILLFPIGPQAYLPNGGIPALLARCPAKNRRGMLQAHFDSNQQLIKLYSAFDTRVFKAYTEFTESFGRYISRSGISAEVWGIEPGHFEGEEFVSFIEDRSDTFHSALSRYIQKKYDFENPISDKKSELREIDEYTGLIRDLYIGAAQDALAPNWEGVMKWSFLRSGERAFFESVSGDYGAKLFSRHLFLGLKNNICVSSCLLDMSSKSDVLKWQLKDVVKEVMIPETLYPEKLEDLPGQGIALRFFSLFEQKGSGFWKEMGLLTFLHEFFENSYSLEADFYFDHYNIISDLNPRFLFVEGRNLEDKKLNEILKIFMGGGQVILSTESLPQDVLRRVELFILENSLEVEEIQHDLSMRLLKLGNGRIFLMDFSKFKDLSLDRKFKFWARFSETLDLKHLYLEHDKDLDFFWSSKMPTGTDFSYDELRRLKVYNNSSYRKDYKIKVPEKFALVKYLDNYNCEIQTKNHEITLTMNPKSMIGLEFGVYE